MKFDNQYSFIVKYYKLEPYFKHLLLHNKGNANPYHNLQHTLNVVSLCNEIASSECMTYNETRTLLIGAIFHDFNYVPGALEDINIKEAIKSLEKFSIEVNNDEIARLIRSTDNSYTGDRNKIEKILFDADRLCWASDTWIHDVFVNLFHLEWVVNFENSLHGEIEFLQNLKLYTKRANEIYAKEYSNRINEINYLMSIVHESGEENG